MSKSKLVPTHFVFHGQEINTKVDAQTSKHIDIYKYIAQTRNLYNVSNGESVNPRFHTMTDYAIYAKSDIYDIVAIKTKITGMPDELVTLNGLKYLCMIKSPNGKTIANMRGIVPQMIYELFQEHTK